MVDEPSRVANWAPLGEPRPVHGSQPGPADQAPLFPWVMSLKPFSRAGVDGRVDEAEIAAALLVEQGDQRGPKRGDSAGAADDFVLAIEADVVAGLG